ncbi:MAG: 4-hydroxyphenylpyruvate dioxygenase [Bdellovibrionaceae bacterium]|nr:4-hydroxyphenylpyruvate dioxygenase [Pseudobdellovibrionaceae bacterium]
MEENPVGLLGLEFIEYTAPDRTLLDTVFAQLGMKEVAKHKTHAVRLFRQDYINFVVNETTDSFAAQFRKLHGPSICSTGFRVKNAKAAFEAALARGARPFDGNVQAKGGWDLPAIYGIGDSLIYFVEGERNGKVYDDHFTYTTTERVPKGRGLILIDHLTNNVPKGEMQKWCDFYTKIFGFQERRYFDIRGKSTGLLSKVMKSPCGTFSIPINEPTEDKSQIQEYLNEYHGSGIQHIALLTDDILSGLTDLRSTGLQFLRAPPATYYEALPNRLPTLTESPKRLQELDLLADGDERGYLLQIFTQNQLGPIFYEIIQRRNHDGFGDGNFQALFDAMEEDQRRRGVL